MNLKKFGVQELSTQEKKSLNGGVFWLPWAGYVAVMAAGYYIGKAYGYYYQD